MPTVTIPSQYNTQAEQIRYLERLEEKLRLIHNAMSKWMRLGLTQEQYNQFPNKIKNRYSYVSQLSRESWDDFRQSIYLPISKEVQNLNSIRREAARNDLTINVDIDRDIV